MNYVWVKNYQNMKKLFFIASVGLLFSCSNGTCVCTSTVVGSDIENGTITTADTYPITGERYYEKDAEENCAAWENRHQDTNNVANLYFQSNGIDVYYNTTCVVE